MKALILSQRGSRQASHLSTLSYHFRILPEALGCVTAHQQCSRLQTLVTYRQGSGAGSIFPVKDVCSRTSIATSYALAHRQMSHPSRQPSAIHNFITSTLSRPDAPLPRISKVGCGSVVSELWFRHCSALNPLHCIDSMLAPEDVLTGPRQARSDLLQAMLQAV